MLTNEKRRWEIERALRESWEPLTIAELAEAIGIVPNTLHGWLRETAPRMFVLRSPLWRSKRPRYWYAYDDGTWSPPEQRVVQLEIDPPPARDPDQRALCDSCHSFEVLERFGGRSLCAACLNRDDPVELGGDRSLTGCGLADI